MGKSGTKEEGVEKGVDKLEAEYWHILLTEGKRPSSVYAFVKTVEMEESDFYRHAANFEALEAAYWLKLIEDTIETLGEDEEYPDYTCEQKLLAFFYTYFLHAQKHRSRMVGFFPAPGCIKGIAPMRQRFIEFAREIIAQGVADGSVADRKKLTDKYPQLLFEQFRSIIEFYRRDQSQSFQDTDALIEKSVRFGSDMARAGTLDSAFDLGRFLLRRFTLPSS